MSKGTKRYSAGHLRKCIWRSLIIMNTVTIPSLICTIPGVSGDTVRRAVRALEIHGYIGKRPGRAGETTVYARTDDTPLLPATCHHCGKSFSLKVCEKDKETKKEKQTKREKLPQVETVAESGTKPAADYPYEGWHVLPQELKDRLTEEVTNDAA
ncbi:hypothetical protein KI809_18885 [Geobacter pelophilus]|uniref:Helix-turn-helix domain-containing protein n=1 Tax=Geoanaerobacter pelophilus TaxID=60036 RepID=A0AAW4L5X5_9BACT|nr:hypothetical protein [Geoanaerobacter pelophilus]MBT0666378.1 hypothetical protein [Geoanaerobacter pelophilus]